MMKQIRKSQNSWFTKSILFLTALSFMSLFGISGYVSSAGKNKSVIQVEKKKILLGDFYAELDNEVARAKSILGDNYNEKMRAIVMQQLIDKNLSNLILDQTARKNGVSISDTQVQRLIFSQPDFKGENGKFNHNIMTRALLLNSLSENQYINMVREDLKKSHILGAPIANINTPKAMAEYVTLAKNLKKSFDYIKIDTNSMKIDRSMSNDEVEQYYQDFIANFTIPETRDANFIFISNSDITKNIKISDAEIKEYYDENINVFEKPETREILQIIVQEENEAKKAFSELKKGSDFFKVATKFANQTKEETIFGTVSSDMMIEEVSEIAFSQKQNEISSPIRSELGWHIVKTTKINPANKTNFNVAKKEITKELQQNMIYSEIQNITRDIDNKVGMGQSFEEIAKSLNSKIYKVTNINEDGDNKSAPKNFKDLSTSKEFVDMVFSYNIGEVSQVIETNDGIALVEVAKINDAYAKDISEVKKEIEKIWAENEKVAISQEIIEDVLYDLENGENLTDIAKRFKLNINSTKPLTRNENFENISSAGMLQLFQADYGSPKVIDMDNVKIIAISKKAKSNNNKISDSEIKIEKMHLDLKLVNEYSINLLNDFGKDLKIKINYSELGFE